jgi:rubrerythrin
MTEKFECMDCGCYFYVENRNDFDCPNCEYLEEVDKDEMS